ncbi:uncharacterized protein LOC132056291 isoform X2 [Lycium ferocissimum]|uniref:uncharacterized protein LOC132056291 isoform X2 n=1 Tax=Lycium ferocissimum TaxID=112874 RepID=UPI0028150250|nr:uncharacterized protein LOC132056291 isoform X2 [Lycium ferocissimum]
MEKEELKWEQNEVEVEEDEVSLQVRSSKVTKRVTNGKIETNVHANSFLEITNGTEKSDLGDEQERSMEQLSDSNNGVEVVEETEPKEVSVLQIVASNNGVEVEEGIEQNEESVEQIVVSNNGVEEETEKSDLGDEQERLEEHLSDSNYGVEEGNEAKEESVQQIVVSNNGVEEVTEKSDLGDGHERPKEHLSDSNNGVEEGTEAKEEVVQQIVVSNNGVEEGTTKSDLGDEQERSEEEQLSDFNNGVEAEEETKEESIHKIVDLNNGVEVEEGTESKEESLQHLVASNIGVEEETEQEEESVQHTVASNNGVEEGIEPKEVSVQQILASNNGVEEGTAPKEVSVQQIVASNYGVEEGTEAKEVANQHLVASTNGVEEGTKAEEGPFRSGHSIYYEKDEGIWKCRTCSWTLQGKSLGIGWTKIPRGHHLDKLMNNPMLDQRGLLFSFGIKDSNFISTRSIKEKIELNGYLKSDNLSSSSAQPSKDLSEYHSIVRQSTAIDEIESAETELIHDSDTDVKDFDVENVIQKQNTHDLYCPNCKSCITRRVILRKRKRKIRVSGDDVKRNKLEVVADSKGDASHAQATDVEVRDGAHSSLDGIPPLAADDYQPDREPEIFRCLSCFSFFIPTGNGFRLFRREKGDKETVKAEQQKVKGEQTPTTNKNWFSSVFALDKGKASVEQGSGSGANAVKNDAGVLTPSDNFKDQSAKPLLIKESAPPAYSSSEITQEAGGKFLGWENQYANMKGKMVSNTVGKSENAATNQEGFSVLDIFEVETRNQPDASASSKEVQGNERDKLLKTAGGVQVSNGNLVQESLPASNDRKDELLRTGGRIQVRNGNRVQESLPASNDRKDELLRTGGRIQVSNGNLVQDSVPAPQQNELNLLITSTKEESLTIEKSETHSKSEVAVLNKDNESLLSPATTAFALNSSDGNGKPKFLTEIPEEHEQHIETMLPSESLVENSDNKFQSLVENSGNKFHSLVENSDNKFHSLVENSDNRFHSLVENSVQLSSNDGDHHYEVSQHTTITKTNIEIHSKQPLNVDQGALISSVKDALSVQDKPDNITNISVGASANGIAGNHTIINMEAGHETTETASANLDTQIQEGQGTDAAEEYKIEIVKSIIFGGLAESITSLSVVSSATGGDATTLNIVVLAMANLIGGLFIIFHNLWELKRDRYEQASNQIMEKHVDRYREQLGRRENFTVHAVLVVLSYIIFGLVPPVIYGFSFRHSDDKELKIVAVAAASLVCILMLSTGKAYVQRAPKPYFKTIAAYVILGFTVSGVSYAAGILFKRLLEKLGLFQPSSTVNLFLPEMPGSGAAWASL